MGLVAIRCRWQESLIFIPTPGSHDWGEYHTHVDATCTEEGYDQHTCNRCGVTETDNVIPALGHDYSAGGHVCQRCGVDAGPVSYIGSDGTEQTCDDYTFITGSGDVSLGTRGATAWYALYGNVSLTQLLLNDNTANLILVDGDTLTISTSSNFGSKVGLKAAYGTLNIYRQSGGSGTLNIATSGDAISVYGAINIYGGNITATSKGKNHYGIYSSMNSSISIAGGNVMAAGDKAGMATYKGNINLSWTNSTDRITANSFLLAGTPNGSLVLSKDFIDENGIFHTPDNIGTLAGKTLAPAIVLADDADNSTAIAAANGTTLATLLNGHTLYRDGNWNTLCLPFNVPNLAGTPLAGFTIMELDTETGKYFNDTGLNGGTLYLNFKDATAIQAGRPYLVKNSGQPAYTPIGGTSNIQGGEYYRLMDGSNQTMWMARMEDGMAYCDIRADEPFHATSYALTTRGFVVQGNNTNPTVWSLKAKLNESDEWTVIDSRNSDTNSEDALPDNPLTPKEFTIQQPGDYQYYRLEVTGVAGGNVIEVMEMTMQGLYATNIENPVFTGVTVSSATPVSIESDDNKVAFVGTYDPVPLTAGDKSLLYLGSGNTLYYPTNNESIGAFSAYFQLAGGSEVIGYVLNFGEGDDVTAISEYSDNSNYSGNNAWYSLDGRRLSGKPSQRGIYIKDGKKLLLK